MPEFDTLEIQQEDILTESELENAEPVEAAEEAPAEPVEAVPEEAPAEIDQESEEESAPDPEEPEDAVAEAISNANARLEAMTAQLSALADRLANLEAQEAARAKKLTGFFAPVKDRNDDRVAGDDPLPRIERQYRF